MTTPDPSPIPESTPKPTGSDGPSCAVATGSASGPLDYDWHKTSEKLPDIAVIVWVSAGGGTALLARYDRYRWESATSIRPLPFSPIYWQHLRLPEPPPNGRDEPRRA